MSLAFIEAEINRFLSSNDPEILCIRGAWGVGKTYAWKKYLESWIENNSNIELKYSYVSLFGLGNIDDVRFAIFERTVTGKNIIGGPNENTFNELISAKRVRSHIFNLGRLGGELLGKRGVVDIAARSAFSTVRDQLICFDDLERAKSSLDIREVLGLSSMLKEERRCKIVIILNDNEHSQKKEFYKYVEKVCDVNLHFSIDASDAISLGINNSDKCKPYVTACIEKLKINNIRIIKRISKASNRIIDILHNNHIGLLDESIATAILAIWSIHDPDRAPTLDFIRNYNRLSTLMAKGRGEQDSVDEKYIKLLSGYPYRMANKLDMAIISAAETGYFDQFAILSAAEVVELERARQQGGGRLSKAWEDLYHGSLATDDEVFYDELKASAIVEASTISPLNINSAIRVLKEGGRVADAEAVIEAYIAGNIDRGYEFFDIEKHHFSAGEKVDDGLKAAFARQRAAFTDERDPLEVLRQIGERSGWSEQDAALLAKQTPAQFEHMLETLKGANMRNAIEMLQHIGRGTSDEHKAIKSASLAAFRRIAAKSPLRARKIRGFGINLDAED
ncbi:hypothetical protein [Xanthobacter flavus]|uniref:hypothetical protein n=1 Tax=Xanthobacter flavus TaxID=281 RepID=UPI00372C7898